MRAEKAGPEIREEKFRKLLETAKSRACDKTGPRRGPGLVGFQGALSVKRIEDHDRGAPAPAVS